MRPHIPEPQPVRRGIDLKAEFFSDRSRLFLLGLGWCALYLLAIIGVNLGFKHLPIFHTVLGPVPAMAFFVGATFVIRDYAQRYAGQWVLLAMAVGLVLSYFLADPYVAMASAAAFLVSEIVDWAVYTYTGRPFHERIALSSAVSVPVDSTLFLVGIGAANVGSIIAMSLSKFAAALLVYLIYVQMEGRNARRAP